MRNLLRLAAVAGALLWAPFAYAQAVVKTSGNGATGTATCTAACNGTALIPSTDTTTMPGILAFQVTAFSGTATISAQQSEDNSTWNVLDCYKAGGTGFQSGTVVNLTNAVTAAYTCQPTLRYVRLQYTAYTSGTQTVVWDFRPGVSQLQTLIPGLNLGIPWTGYVAGTTGAVTMSGPGAANRTSYLCGFIVTTVAASGTSGPISLTNTLGFPVFQVPPVTAGTVLQQNFTPCLPATQVSFGHNIITTANASATSVNIFAWGYEL